MNSKTAMLMAAVVRHLSWVSVDGRFMNELLPLPYTEEALRHTAARVRTVQDVLGRQILIENVSSYLQFTASEMPEWEFLVALAAESGCAILLDLNNVYVNAMNHSFDPYEYLDFIAAACGARDSSRRPRSQSDRQA